MGIILVTLMTFRLNFTEQNVWVTNAFSTRQLQFWSHRQDPKRIQWVFVCLYSAVTHKRFVNNSVPAITPTCTSHSDQFSRLSQYVMLQNVKYSFFMFSPTLFRPDRRHLFSSFSQGQTAVIEPWQLATSRERNYRIKKKLFLNLKY